MDILFAHSGDTRQTRLDVYLHVVGEELLVESTVGAVEGECLDARGLTLAHTHTAARHLGREKPLGGCKAVLHIHHSHVAIGALLEVDLYARRTGVSSRRHHIYHILHAVYGLLDGNHHTLLNGLGIGSGIVRPHTHRRWRNLGELFHRKPQQGYKPQQHYRDRDHAREDGTVNKSLYRHFASVLALITVPSFMSPAPSDTMTSPG